MKISSVFTAFLIIAAAALVGFPLFLSPESRSLLVIRGSTTLYPSIRPCVDHFLEQHPGMRITLTAEGSGSGIAALLDDQADIAMSSRPLRPEEESLIETRHLEIERYPLGQDGIAIIVHPKNPIEDVALSDLHGMYTGAISSWAEIGGRKDMMIPISRDVSSGTYVVFRNYVLQSQDIATAVQLVPSNEAMVHAVADDERAVGYIGLGYLNDRVKAVAVNGIHPEPHLIATGEYPLSRELFLFARKESDELKDAFLDFVLGGEGQKIIDHEYTLYTQ